MTRIELEIHDDIAVAINKIQNLNDTGIELFIPEGSILFDNSLNIKLIKKEAEKAGKTINFETNDKLGSSILLMLSEGDEEDFAPKEISAETEESNVEPKEKKSRFRMPAFVSVAGKGKGRKSKWLKILIVLLILGGIGAFAATRALDTAHTADVKVVVNAQPLIKSVQIKVIKDGDTDANAKTLKGSEASTLVTNVGTAETTGEKLIGEKAEGEIKIFNKTADEKEFDKGQIVIYKDGDTRLEFELKDDVTVPERTEDPETLVITPGEAKVDVVAVEIGDQFNIDEDEDLDIDDEDDDDFTAKSENDFSGGKSDKVKVVSEEDKTTLSTQVFDDNVDNIEDELQSRAGAGKKYIRGSMTTEIANETFEPEVDEESDELKLTQEVTAAGLAYSQSELERLLEEMLDEFVPSGYKLSSKDSEINVEILGNTETTVLTPEESDLQVTIKAFVITDINEEEIKNSILGKTIEEAKKYLGGIRNIEMYELEVSPNIPFLQRVPTNPENVTVTIEKN